MRYDASDIEHALLHGAPDPEGNVRRANEILALIDARRYEEARGRLQEITDPDIQNDINALIEFETTCLCIPQEDLISPMS